MAGLVSISDADMQALHRAIDFLFTEVEQPAALAPNQTAENRALNCGRAAALLDLKQFLTDRRAKARELLKKAK